MKATILLLLVAVTALVGCTATPVQIATPITPVPEPAAPCVLEPIAVPTLPAEIPGYTELDPSTGLHMTGTVTEIDLVDYRLAVTGKVDHPLSLTYDELRCMPRTEAFCTINCPGFFQDEATWAGVPLDDVLALAGVHEDAAQLRLVSADGYATVVSMDELTSGSDFLAYEWEGEPVPVLHGFPVRAVFPALNGNKWVKWLVEIEVI